VIHYPPQAEKGGGVDLLGALRAMDDDQLAELLSRRPDLAEPPPPDFETLAERAGWSRSLERCMGGLDHFATQLVEALCLLPDVADPPPALPGRAGLRLRDLRRRGRPRRGTLSVRAVHHLTAWPA
jgi:hypothetical protein